jgi:DNA replication protein DnaC
MTEMLDSYVKQAASSSMSYMDFLSGLVSEEVRHKEQRAVQSRIKSARFPVLKSLDDFDYAFQPSIDRKKLAELSSLRFIDNKENILFLGPPGIGKTHLSTGLGVQACESGYKVLFTTLNDMVSVLMASMADNSFPSKLRQFVQPSLLIIDEVGYLPVSKEPTSCFRLWLNDTRQEPLFSPATSHSLTGEKFWETVSLRRPSWIVCYIIPPSSIFEETVTDFGRRKKS